MGKTAPMASFSRPTLLVVGAGFLGREVARVARDGGWDVIPVVRSEESATVLRKKFPKTVASDALEAGFWTALPKEVSGVVWAVAPSRERPKDDFEAMQRMGAVAAARWVRKKRVPYVYISSTSVYAEDGGAWVSEESPLAVEDPRSLAMVEAEQACVRAGGTVLRCAGLYGNERLLKPDTQGPERWLNLVEVKDAARAVGVALRYRGKILNACEDQPRRRGRAGGTWPEGSRRARRNKRVSNGRLRALGWIPQGSPSDAEPSADLT